MFFFFELKLLNVFFQNLEFSDRKTGQTTSFITQEFQSSTQQGRFILLFLGECVSSSSGLVSGGHRICCRSVHQIDVSRRLLVCLPQQSMPLVVALFVIVVDALIAMSPLVHRILVGCRRRVLGRRVRPDSKAFLVLWLAQPQSTAHRLPDRIRLPSRARIALVVVEQCTVELLVLPLVLSVCTLAPQRSDTCPQLFESGAHLLQLCAVRGEGRTLLGQRRLGLLDQLTATGPASLQSQRCLCARMSLCFGRLHTTVLTLGLSRCCCCCCSGALHIGEHSFIGTIAAVTDAIADTTDREGGQRRRRRHRAVEARWSEERVTAAVVVIRAQETSVLMTCGAAAVAQDQMRTRRGARLIAAVRTVAIVIVETRGRNRVLVVAHSAGMQTHKAVG
mmetsp:Transcript_8545/g.26501  ORF Transcript_8545/g.26501 Transcript_8545/m.26501 type:complete len:392 (-) Transcript_8545:226-1401(-)